MQRLIRHICILAIILQQAIYSHTSAQCVFHKLSDNNDKNDGGFSIIQTLNGGYIACGNTIGMGLAGLYIIRTDICGDTIWTKEYDFSPLGGDNGNSILQLADSSFVICGTRFDSIEGASDSYLLNLNNGGGIIWYKPVEGGFNDRGITHSQTEDSGFIIGGHNFDSALTFSQAFLIKTDSLGNVLWQQQYEDSTYLYALDRTRDGGYVISGEIMRSTGDWDLFLTKTDSAGNEQWTKYYGDNYDQFQGYAVTCFDGGYVMIGRTYNASGDMNGYILKTDSLGEIVWERDYGISIEAERFKYVVQTSDGNYVVAGGTSDQSVSPTAQNVFLHKYNENGDSLWYKEYSYYGGTTHTYVEDLNFTLDGGLILAGYIINNALPAKNDLWVLKTDEEGDTCTLDTSSNGCAELICYAAITTSANTVYLSGSTSIDFYGGASNPISWLWDFGDGSTSVTTQNPSHTYDSVGTYLVTLVVDNDSCADTAYTVISVINDVSIQYEVPSEQYRLSNYPNPFDNSTTITVYLADNTWQGELIIHGLLGNQIAVYKLISGDNSIEISSDDLGAGLHFYSLVLNKEKVATKKMVVLK